MSYNVKPGDKAEIIGSVLGPSAPSIGRIVRVHANHPGGEYRNEMDEKYCNAANDLNDPKHYCPPSPYEKEHTVWGKIWPVSCINGGTFSDINGNIHNCIDVPDQFLRKIIETDTDSSKETTKELETE